MSVGQKFLAVFQIANFRIFSSVWPVFCLEIQFPLLTVSSVTFAVLAGGKHSFEKLISCFQQLVFPGWEQRCGRCVYKHSIQPPVPMQTLPSREVRGVFARWLQKVWGHSSALSFPGVDGAPPPLASTPASSSLVGQIFLTYCKWWRVSRCFGGWS